MTKPTTDKLIHRQLASVDWPANRVVVGVSGGADSVALLRALAAFAGLTRHQLVVAHLNHGLRAEAAADQQFVVALADRLGVVCHVDQADVAALAAAQGDGIEAAARTARYEFFKRTATQFDAGMVLTAHTADDSAETILQRIIRGTGLDGLRGIQRRRRLADGIELCRPLLGVRRPVLREFLDELGQTYREDASNLDVRFMRNRIRHELLPMLQSDYNPAVVESLLRLGELATDVQSVMQQNVKQLLEHVTLRQSTADRIVIDFAQMPPTALPIVREFLRSVWRRAGWPEQAMGQREWDKMARLAVEQTAVVPTAIESTATAPDLAQNSGALRDSNVQSSDQVDLDEEILLHWPHLAETIVSRFTLPLRITAEKRGSVLTLTRG